MGGRDPDGVGPGRGAPSGVSDKVAVPVAPGARVSDDGENELLHALGSVEESEKTTSPQVAESLLTTVTV